MSVNIQSLLSVFELNADSTLLISLIVGLTSFISLSLFKHAILQHLKYLAKKTKWQFDDTLVQGLYKLDKFFLLFISIITATFFLALPLSIRELLDRITFIIVVVYAVRVLQTLVAYSIHRSLDTDQESESSFDPSFVSFLSQAVQLVVWIIALVLIAENIGYNVTAILGGLGIVGIAIAFALQNVLSDIFSFFSIYMDKPFKTGDFIITDKDAGTVQKIGLKSTRLKTLQGQELVISNKELTEKRINNYKRMEQRRVVFHLRVSYTTSRKKLEKINQIIKDIIEAQEHTEFDRVHFHEIGEYSLNFEAVYKMTTKEYEVYMNTQQTINLAIKEAFEKEKIEFAYPTQAVLINGK